MSTSLERLRAHAREGLRGLHTFAGLLAVPAVSVGFAWAALDWAGPRELRLVDGGRGDVALVAGAMVVLWLVGAVAWGGITGRNVLRRPGPAGFRGAVALLGLACAAGGVGLAIAGDPDWDEVGMLVLVGAVFVWSAWRDGRP